MDIQVRIDRMIDYEGSKLKAIASANIGGVFAVHGIRVIGSEKGLFVQMPQISYEKEGRRLYSDVFHPITAGSRSELIAQTLEAYKQKLDEEMQAEESEQPAVSQTM